MNWLNNPHVNTDLSNSNDNLFESANIQHYLRVSKYLYDLSGPDDDPLMSVVIDAALTHLVESEENIYYARGVHAPVTIQELCNTSVIGLQYRTRIKIAGDKIYFILVRPDPD